ncbi:MAG: hypothetical protein BM555_02390 [Crocinitomix sp. MedPE-SWsnd]|nr:MAG: hypothetical protein BM555_02390 [Crocinitomix sp. MedPE-SWsnd]
MRSELETLEQIDQYLGGKMTAENAASFKAEIAADPKLQSLVKDQQLLIQTVNRQALMAEINSVAGLGAAGGAAGAAGWGIAQWAITALVVAVVGVGGYFIYDNYQSEDLPVDSSEEFLAENSVEEFASDTGDIISFAMEDGLDSELEEEVIDANVDHEVTDRSDGGNISVDKNIDRNDNVNTMVPFVTANDVNAVNNNEKDEKDLSQTPVHSVAKNRKATYPGGLLKMKEFFKKEMRYPRTPRDKGLAGTVKVNFLVTADGKIMELASNCFILKDAEGLKLSQFKYSSNGKSRRIFEDKAEAIFRKSSPWTPATNAEGNPTLSEQTWYVNFDLKGESSIYQLEEDVLHDDSKIMIERNQ